MSTNHEPEKLWCLLCERIGDGGQGLSQICGVFNADCEAAQGTGPFGDVRGENCFGEREGGARAGTQLQ